MKKYMTPSLQMVTLRVEESIAVAAFKCDGACTHDVYDKKGKLVCHAHGS
jgi:hypothetical protein